MKENLLLILLLQLPLFTACNSTKPTLNNNAHQEASVSFPEASTRSKENVICQNCRANFKISMAMHKQNGQQTYIECPICHHDYLKKAH